MSPCDRQPSPPGARTDFVRWFFDLSNSRHFHSLCARKQTMEEGILRHRPAVWFCRIEMRMSVTGLEPVTSSMSTTRASQLRHTPEWLPVYPSQSHESGALIRPPAVNLSQISESCLPRRGPHTPQPEPRAAITTRLDISDAHTPPSSSIVTAKAPAPCTSSRGSIGTIRTLSSPSSAFASP
jgi:hypothetical protein